LGPFGPDVVDCPADRVGGQPAGVAAASSASSWAGLG